MLYIWSDAHPKHIKNTIGVVLQGHKGLEHKFVPTPEELKEGDVLLCLGGKYLEAMQKDGLCPKGRTITSMRGKPIPVGKGTAFVTYDPRVQEIDYGKISEIQWDSQLAIRYLTTGQMLPTIGDYRYTEDFTDVLNHVYTTYETTGKRVPIACDLETIGLNPYNESAYIVTIFFTYKEGQADGVHFTQGDAMPQKLYDQLEEILNSDKITIRGANFKFDLAWMWEKWEIKCTNFTMDTTIVGSLLDENRSNSLNTHAKVYTPMGGYDDAFNKKYDKSRMDLVPTDDLLSYAGGDTDACLRVSEIMREELSQDAKLARFYTKLVHPASRAFEDIEQEGILIDVPYTLALSKELEEEIDDLEEQAISMMSGRLRRKHHGELRLSRDAVIKDFMFTPYGLNLKPEMWTEAGMKLDVKHRELKHVSSALEHLLMFQGHPEAARFIDIVKKRAAASKTKTTFVDGFLKHLRQDGRYHPTFVLYKGDYGGDSGDDSGTVTGRTALKDPALQTLPKHTSWAKKLRKGYIAPPGYVIVSCDYSQGELRVTACVANETNMIQAYNDGLDLHLKTGANLNGYDLDDLLKIPKKLPDGKDNPEYAIMKKLRQGGKAGNFGLIYGMSAGGYQVYAESTYGVVLTEEEANNQRNTFFDMYPGLTAWHREFKGHAKDHGFVRSPLGRVRHLPLIKTPNSQVRSKAERQAINSPIQSCLSDMLQFAFVQFKKEFGTPRDCRCFLMTHDDSKWYVKEDQLDVWIPRIRGTMENLPLHEFDWNPPLKFVADVEVGYNLAEMSEL